MLINYNGCIITAESAHWQTKDVICVNSSFFKEKLTSYKLSLKYQEKHC